MICNKCGSEIPDGHLFCSHCGNEINLVAEYDMRDDLIVSPDIVNDFDEKQKNTFAGNFTFILKKIKKEKVFFIMLFAFFISLLLLFIVNYNKNQNSVQYQMSKAVEFYNMKKYYLAIKKANKAVELDETNPAAYELLGDAYSSVLNYSNAELSYKKAIEYEKENEIYYVKLFSIYSNENKFREIKEEIESSPIKDKLMKNYSMCYPNKPKIELESGVYNENLKIRIGVEGGLKIFYSLNGSRPDETSNVYEKPITLNKEGSYILKAVCMNEYGIFSEIVMNNYEIIYPIPDSPIVTPSTGRYGSDSLIKVITDENCNAYYSWNGSIPTIHSSKYSLPVKMKKGSHMFTVVAINEYGKVSLPTVRSFEVSDTDTEED